jgi:cytidylate kinase
LIRNGENQSLEKLIDEIRLRDKLDSERENAPLVKAKDAIVIDTSIKTIDEQVDFIIDAIKSNMKGNKNE